jgi:hypothetical protein
MNKLTALVLVVAVPALAQHRVSLVPAAPQADATAAFVRKERPLHERAETWIVAGIATVAVAAVITGLIVVGIQAAARPNTPETPGLGQTPPPKQDDFACNPNCDGWVNKPAK